VSERAPAEPFLLKPHERRLILRLRQLERNQVGRVTVDLEAWRIVEKTDVRPEELRDRPPPAKGSQ
jgi:hypothetical protein